MNIMYEIINSEDELSKIKDVSEKAIIDMNKFTSSISSVRNSYKKFIKILINTFKNGNKETTFIIINKYPSYKEDFEIVLKALEIDDKKLKYEFIYDKACEYLDKKFSKYNYCDFKNDQCVANREPNGYDSMGCCHSFELKSFCGIPSYHNERVCKYLNEKTCSTKNISCKLFTCKYLRKKGITFNPKDIIYLNCFLNEKQMDILRFNFFRKKEEILDKLMEKNHIPYLWWFFIRGYKIK